MEEYTELEHHYHVTPKGLTREECWQDLSNYLREHAKWNMIWFREVPIVFSDFNYDTKQDEHRGIVRFSMKRVEYPDVITIPSIGETV